MLWPNNRAEPEAVGHHSELLHRPLPRGSGSAPRARVLAACSCALACSGPAEPLQVGRDASIPAIVDARDTGAPPSEELVLASDESCPVHERTCNMSVCLLLESRASSPVLEMTAERDGRPMTVHRCAAEETRGFAFTLPWTNEEAIVTVAVHRDGDVCWSATFRIEGYIGYGTLLFFGDEMERCWR